MHPPQRALQLELDRERERRLEQQVKIEQITRQLTSLRPQRSPAEEVSIHTMLLEHDRALKLSHAELHLLLLIQHLNKTRAFRVAKDNRPIIIHSNSVFPSLLAYRLGVSDRQIRRLAAPLVKKQWIERICNRYQLGTALISELLERQFPSSRGHS